ncbi:unnamed protein product [Prorocentrum cordatum]|uniref:Uncharacterized protein n=1 Tax=Prorocentrum cordatum TaxID=2364126 RepID=A0ABN9TAA8_9DINO|nr:unnamed protein product [Polarella glacialis]
MADADPSLQHAMTPEGEPLFTREDAIVEFTKKFHIDEAAINRLRNLPDDQLQRVFNEFNPAQDHNPDYSRRLMGFLKTVTYNTGPAPPGSTGALLAGGTGAVDPGQYSGPIVSVEQLDMFRMNYPMDERAYDYLKIAPPDVQERVISTFRANCVQDDYSRMITAHVKFCMSKRDQPGHITGSGGGGYQQQHNPSQPTVSVEAAYQAITGTIPLGAVATGAVLPEAPAARRISKWRDEDPRTED